MDDVLDSFNKTLKCEGVRNGPKLNGYESLYKNWGKYHTQEERRKEILKVQKGHRNDNLDNFRGILEFVSGIRTSDVNADQKSDKKKDDIFENQKVPYRPSIYVAGFHKTSPKYDNVLMLSEWLIEKPIDFHKNWYVVPCPKGVRTLVISDQGITKFFTKHGGFMMECKTGLPGGNPWNNYRKKGVSYCVLDGIYVEKINTLYVLDLLAWNSQPMTDGETEFRQFWLKAHLHDLKDTYEISKMNRVKFKLLPMVECSQDSLNEFMMKGSYFEFNYPPLDGFLFYHKLAHYFAGETPLVGWLYPFMVREVLGLDVTVNDIHERGRPTDYVNQAEFIQKFEQQHPKKYPKDRSTTMEIVEPEEPKPPEGEKMGLYNLF